VQDILDMGRIDAAAVPIEPQWVTAADVVDAATAHVRHALEGRTVRVEADGDAQVQIDPRIGSAALAHLLENAAQYSPSEREIVVTAHVAEDGLTASVVDQGLDSIRWKRGGSSTGSIAVAPVRAQAARGWDLPSRAG
jgi:two-component system sensor histidine kinase KdpD